MKYMGKRECAPKGMNPTFMLASRKNGGIGSAYAEKLRAFMNSSPTPAICLYLISIPDNP